MAALLYYPIPTTPQPMIEDGRSGKKRRSDSRTGRTKGIPSRGKKIMKEAAALRIKSLFGARGYRVDVVS
jgi:hypothetical protein